MSIIDMNKETSRRWIEMYNAHDQASQDACLAPGFVAYAPASLESEVMQHDSWTRFLDGFSEGFPDLAMSILGVVAEGDLVAQRVHFDGTHTGFFQGLPPTGRTISIDGLELNRLDEDGRVVEHWFHMDALGLLQQLGLKVVPGPRLLPRLLISPITKWRMRSRR